MCAYTPVIWRCKKNCKELEHWRKITINIILVFVNYSILSIKNAQAFWTPTPIMKWKGSKGTSYCNRIILSITEHLYQWHALLRIYNIGEQKLVWHLVPWIPRNEYIQSHSDYPISCLS